MENTKGSDQISKCQGILEDFQKELERYTSIKNKLKDWTNRFVGTVNEDCGKQEKPPSPNTFMAKIEDLKYCLQKINNEFENISIRLEDIV